MNLVLQATFSALLHSRAVWTPGGEDSYDSSCFKGLFFEASCPWHQERKSMDTGVKRQKKTFHSKNDPFIKPVCELKILNESDPVGKKKSNCSVQKKFSAGKHIRKFTGTANTSPVGNSLNKMHFALTAVLKFSSSQDWDLFHFTNKNATNNSFKKEEFTMWAKIKDQILIFITLAYIRHILHHFT